MHQDSNELPRRDLGPYRLLSRLGAGGMAEVYLARASGASGFEKRVALKVLRPELADNPTLIRSLIEEARLGARLSHRNLVSVQDLGVAEGIYYLRLDYVDGADLRRLCDAGERPDAALALLVAEEIASALEVLHGVCDDQGRPLGLVHRDVSPTNILLSRHGDVKLTDYGVVKVTSLATMTQANVRKGKYAYMSPEQIQGRALSPASDHFALGVTLAELLCGERPFDGETPHQVMEAICQAATPTFDELDDELRILLRRLLARDAEERFPSTAALREELRACRHALYPASLAELGAWVRGVLDSDGPEPTRDAPALTTGCLTDCDESDAAVDEES